MCMKYDSIHYVGVKCLRCLLFFKQTGKLYPFYVVYAGILVQNYPSMLQYESHISHDAVALPENDWTLISDR